MRRDSRKLFLWLIGLTLIVTACTAGEISADVSQIGRDFDNEATATTTASSAQAPLVREGESEDVAAEAPTGFGDGGVTPVAFQ